MPGLSDPVPRRRAECLRAPGTMPGPGRCVCRQMPTNADDWDVMVCNLQPSFGKAMDYTADNDAKMKAIQAKHFKTPDEKQQEAVTAKRIEMRRYLWTRAFREINLRPM